MDRTQTAFQKGGLRLTAEQSADETFSSCLRLGSEVNWANLPGLHADPKLFARNRIVTAYRSDTAHVPFDMLRTSLLQNMRQNKWTSVAITSPTPACGKTVVSLNLAFSLVHQKECRTALIDLDLRRPQVAKLLGLKNPPLIESFLRGEVEIADTFVRYSDNVAIAANSRPVRFAAELLQNSDTANALKRVKQALCPDITIFDMPPMLANDDFLAFLPNVDCVLLVVAAETTTFRDADYCERLLAEKTNVVGVVLNKCQYTPDKYGY
ncbi:CpsD/CapB family tyrosine-protein kinase [Mesorhizobium yinganensis]|uniref:CpsD/CapB family tyrosine-protein kinase n=1 Tax=Mesorhizobium yinganensis TaxID=3157707 RepID=UPI003CCCF777